MLLVVGLSHRSAPIDVRERLALSKEQGAALAKRLCSPSGCLREAAILSTCNRVEVYAVPSSPR